MSKIESLMSLERPLMKAYTQDIRGMLPVREIARRVGDRCISLSRDPSLKPRVIILTGLRGVGKTTILFQTMERLLKEDKELDDVVYFSMDRASLSGATIRDLVEDYEKNILGDHLVSSSDTKFFMIDEAHYSKDWDLQVKTLTDEAPNVAFIVSGSSSLELSKSPDLARRSVSVNVPPLDYMEYLLIKTRREIKGYESVKIGDLLIEDDPEETIESFENSINRIRKNLRELNGYSPGYLENYILKGGLPYSVDVSDPYEIIYDTIRRVLERDVPLIGKHDTNTLRSIPTLIGMIAPSPDISMNSLSRDIEGISIKSIRSILDTLYRSGLIFEVEHFGSVKKSLRIDTRKYFASSSLSSSILHSMGGDPLRYMGSLVETATSSTLYRSGSTSFCVKYIKGKGLADFIVKTPSGNVAFEVGYGKKDNGMRQLKNTMKRVSCSYGILIADIPDLSLERDIIKIPLREFFCL